MTDCVKGRMDVLINKWSNLFNFNFIAIKINVARFMLIA